MHWSTLKFPKTKNNTQNKNGHQTNRNQPNETKQNKKKERGDIKPKITRKLYELKANKEEEKEENIKKTIITA